MLAGIHEICQLWPPGAELLCHLAPCLAGMGAVGMIESLPDRGRDDLVLATRDMREGVAHPVNAAAFPGGFEESLEIAALPQLRHPQVQSAHLRDTSASRLPTGRALLRREAEPGSVFPRRTEVADIRRCRGNRGCSQHAECRN